MTERAIMAGWGGQGMMTLGKLMAWTMMQEGKEVTCFPSYGAEVRGGTAHCHVVLSDQPINSPIVERADTLIIMNQPSYELFRERLRPGGLLLLNSSLVDEEDGDANVLKIPATHLATELGNTRVANSVMLGAYNHVRQFVPVEKLMAGIDQALTGRKAALREINHKAIQCGRETAEGLTGR